VYQGLLIGDLTFPNHKHAPPLLLQLAVVLDVALYIFRELFVPKFLVRFRAPSISTILMLMPKASVHENNLLAVTEHYIGLAREVGDVELEPIAHRVQQSPDRHL